MPHDGFPYADNVPGNFAYTGTAPKPAPCDNRTVLMNVAKKASEDAGRNASVAPQLLFAHILWALEAAQAAGTITVHTDPSRKPFYRDGM